MRLRLSIPVGRKASPAPWLEPGGWIGRTMDSTARQWRLFCSALVDSITRGGFPFEGTLGGEYTRLPLNKRVDRKGGDETMMIRPLSKIRRGRYQTSCSGFFQSFDPANSGIISILERP